MELSPLFTICRYTFWVPQHPEIERSDTKLSFKIKFVLSNVGCILSQKSQVINQTICSDDVSLLLPNNLTCMHISRQYNENHDLKQF